MVFTLFIKNHLLLFSLYLFTGDIGQQTLDQSVMAATGVYTSWSGYLQWNHVTDLNVRDS